MATKGAEAAAQDSSDSDDSMNGARPTFSTGKRIRPEELLESSNKFMEFYAEHLPHLQQTIVQLFGNTVFYIERVIAESRSGAGGFAAWVCRVGQNLSPEDVLLGPSTSASSFYRLSSGEDKQRRNRDELLKQAERAVETFQTTTGNANIHLKNICKDVEEILKYQRDEQSTSLRHELTNLRKNDNVLAEMAVLFKQDDLEIIVEQAHRNFRNTEYLNYSRGGLIGLLSLIIGLFSENYKILRDFDELKYHSSVQGSNLRTEAGKVVLEIRGTLKHLLKTLNEVIDSKPGLEKVLIPKLKQYIEKRNV